MKGKIIIGHPGGMFEVFGKDRCIYLDGYPFSFDGKYPDKWHIPYCETARSLASQGYQVYIDYTEYIVIYFVEMLEKYGKPWNIDEIILEGPSKELREAFNNILNILEIKEKANEKDTNIV